MDAEPTPGEWYADRADLNADDPDDADPDRWAVLVKVEGRPHSFLVATVENGAPGDTMDTEEANARLMAASKDLLAALKACAAVCAGETSNKGGLIAALELARSALAKAEARP
jgi:hypothetical protein